MVPIRPAHKERDKRHRCEDGIPGRGGKPGLRPAEMRRLVPPGKRGRKKGCDSGKVCGKPQVVRNSGAGEGHGQNCSRTGTVTEDDAAPLIKSCSGPGRRFLPQPPPLSPRARPPETPPPVGLPLLPSRCHSPASHRGLGRLPSQASPSSPGTGRSSRSTRQRSPRRAPHSRLLLGAAGASGGGGAAAAVGAVSNPTGRSSKMAAPGPRGAR